MALQKPLTLGIVAGEESGDLLAADLVHALMAMTGQLVRLVGIGGEHLQKLGLQSLFDANEISLMGVTAVLRDAPRLVRRIGQAARAIAGAEPDCLVTVDVPDFSLRVAKKVRSLVPDLPTVHYVSPSVWAWRPGRAGAMAGFIDHVLCILPFEPAELLRLGGPPGTYVGHRLTHDPGVLATRAARAAKQPVGESTSGTLLLLPGSRRSEVMRLLPDFQAILAVLHARGFQGRVLLPTVPKVAGLVQAAAGGWPLPVDVVEGQGAKWRAFADADAALIASGTVSLELALCGVPHVSTYRFDPIGRFLKGAFVKSWTGSLPNLIADRPVIPEFFDVDIRPGALARHMESLMRDTDLRRWQISGFDTVAQEMQTERPAGEAAAAVVLDRIRRRKA